MPSKTSGGEVRGSGCSTEQRLSTMRTCSASRLSKITPLRANGLDEAAVRNGTSSSRWSGTGVSHDVQAVAPARDLRPAVRGQHARSAGFLTAEMGQMTVALSRFRE